MVVIDRKKKSMALVISVIAVAILSSMITYYYQEQKKWESRTILEVVEINQDMIKIKNSGNLPATGLSSNPPGFFEPPDIEPGEVTIGRFESPIYGAALIKVVSKEGSQVDYQYEEDSD